MEKHTRSSFRSITTLAFTAIIALSCASAPADPSPIPSPATEAETESGATASSDPLDFEFSISSQTVKDGSLVELRLKPKEPIDPLSVVVKLEGAEFPVIPLEKEELLALVVAPFNSKPRTAGLEIHWKAKGGLAQKKSFLPLKIVDGNYRSEVLKVQEEKINPPKRVLKRILAEQKEIGAIYRKIRQEKLWNGAFLLPIESEITSPFGNKRLYNGSMKNFHQGLDLRARTPTPIRAPEGARVVLAKDLYFTGNTVILDHGYGLFTIYGHMSKLHVKKGETVKKEQVLGLSGATGRASGPHLHWGAVLMRQKFNPQDLIQVLH
jgi:murein DD-endopeptidase MepM/ murein hydrolase activator NlpD